ncbi:MAG: BrnT family toxin [Anaerolineales bacterium]
MYFDWDAQKNEINLRKHGLDFSDAWEVFTEPMLVALDDREDYGEDRYIGIGMLRSRAVVVLYTERDDDTIRIISLRKALTHERKQYEKLLKDQLAPD